MPLLNAVYANAKRHLPSPIVIFELMLLCAVSFGCVRLVNQVLIVRAEASRYSTSAARQADELGMRQSIIGRDVFGNPTEHGIPKQTKHLVVFVVRRATYQSDIAFWSQMTKLLPPNHRIWFLGYCDGSACNRETLRWGKPDFSLIAYGEVAGLEAAHSADALGKLLVTDNRARIIARFAWRGSEPQAAAAYLLRFQ